MTDGRRRRASSLALRAATPQVRSRFCGPLAAGILALLASSAVLPATARADDVAISASARTHFSAGVRLLQDPGGARYEEAYQEFRVAYADSPSPRILGNIGLCAMKLERDEEALRAYEKYLAGVPNVDPAERKQIESDLVTLRASIATVTLTIGTPDVRVVDQRTPVQGAPITNVYGPLAAGATELGLHPGHHTLTAKREGYVSATWEIDALPSSKQTHVFTLAKVAEATPAPAPVVVAPPPVLAPVAPPPPDVMIRPVPKAVFAMTGVTLALGVSAAITGAVAVSTKSSFDAVNDGTRVPDAQSLHDTGQRLNVATDVLWGTAVASAVVTVVLYATRPSVRANTAWGGSTPPRYPQFSF
jgi:hypothetical protein